MDVFKFRAREESRVEPEIEDMAHQCIGVAIEVHRHLGPGLPEKVYRNAMSHELSLRLIPHVCEALVPILYKGIRVGEGKTDILVAAKLVLELKAVEALNEVHRGQAIGYLQATNLPLAILINFNVIVLRDGIKRVINTYQVPH